MVQVTDESEFKKARQWLLEEKPEQFTAILSGIKGLYQHGGFKSLHEFTHAPVGKGGLGLTDAKLNALLYYNPAYRSSADELATTLNLAEKAKGIDAIGENGGFKQIDNSKNINLHLGGTSSVYRIAKLKRDFPEVATRLEEGEFKNVADAERASGIKPPKKRLKRFSIDLDDLAGSELRFNEMIEKLKEQAK